MQHQTSPYPSMKHSTMKHAAEQLTLDQQRQAFCRRRFLATPLAGAICWGIVGLAGYFLSPTQAALVLFIATGSIVYLAMLIARFTGENFFNKGEAKNTFDNLFLRTVFSSFLIYALAIPFFMLDHSSLPLTVGILTGTMWLPFSWIIQHWIGTFHAISRTLLIVAAWYGFPEHRFVAIPLVILAIYGVSIVVLERRWMAINNKPITETPNS
jgi:hypothetical protein